MSSLLRAILLLTALASCGGSNYSAPRNLDNACSIIQQRPTYLKAMAATERRWGVPVAVQMAAIYQESKFIGNAKTPHRYALGIIPMGRQSSAYGYAQALDGTWDEYRSDQRRFGARRDRISDATDFMGWYMHESYERLGIPKNDVQLQYLPLRDFGFTAPSRACAVPNRWRIAMRDILPQLLNLPKSPWCFCPNHRSPPTAAA